MPLESSVATKPVFAIGPHNAGCYIAFIVWIACSDGVERDYDGLTGFRASAGDLAQISH